MLKRLVLPPNRSCQDAQTIETEGTVVIIGANGSGKSRLGAWIDTSSNQNGRIVHRIAAQRALTLPDTAILKSYDDALMDLLYGNALYPDKIRQRWQSRYTTGLLNDYDKVLSVLFATEAKRNAEYVELARGSDTKPDIPVSPMDTLLTIWRDLLPHRTLILRDAKVSVVDNTGNIYHGREMSDGERVALYLMAQCLCAPPDAILVIDEPEIHLHRALMSRLWTSLEQARDDCLFVYITHDLEFAASRSNSTKIWVKSYSHGEQWDWEIVPDVDNLPESIVLEILGSRKQILFVEGTKDSLDYIIYSALYPDCTVIPRGSCVKVIESTKAMRDNPRLHHLQAYGIIDRDFRSQEELDALSHHGILYLDVAEIENIFCVPEVISMVAEHLRYDPVKKVAEATDFVVDNLRDEMDSQISSRTIHEIKERLTMLSPKGVGSSNIEQALKKAVSEIDAHVIYSKYEEMYRRAMSSKDLVECLRLYNRKSIVSRISQIFGLKNGEYVKLVLRLLSGPHGRLLRDNLSKYAPLLPS
ncbi:DUF4435 domain-containing protein [Alicyclobacillus macrosporangiidus]|uniref:DUF4435 domain-containing protein n=1 Tax=Alicyclobacillus macrosporangiidus TaxID=392015 RepID=UPI0018CC6FAE|nr:DUF4435 domain-containing protein [Alicyclobacillus macrosporangiidus]